MMAERMFAPLKAPDPFPGDQPDGQEPVEPPCFRSRRKRIGPRMGGFATPSVLLPVSRAA